MRDLRWIAQYADGRIVKEQDFVGSWVRGRWVENLFPDLDLPMVISFGLEGSGIRVGFRADDGIIGINGVPLELALEDQGGNIFALTAHEDVFYRPIQYKEASFSISSGAGRQKPDGDHRIEAYCVGWETSGEETRIGSWRSKCVVRIPSCDDEAVTALLWFLCSKGFTGILRVRVNGKERPTVNTILRPEVINQIALRVGG